MGQGEPVAAALDALRAGDLDAFTDRLHRCPLCHHGRRRSWRCARLAESIVAEGLAAGFAPTATVDEITATLVRSLRHDRQSLREYRTCPSEGAQSRRSIVESGALDDAALRRGLLTTFDEIARLRAERDALETRVDELAGARVLADQLAAELERDEWIRARLRRAQSDTPGTRADLRPAQAANGDEVRGQSLRALRTPSGDPPAGPQRVDRVPQRATEGPYAQYDRAECGVGGRGRVARSHRTRSTTPSTAETATSRAATIADGAFFISVNSRLRSV